MHTSEASESIKGIALIGAPNSGKTTLYNWLTGSKFKTVNYPGATVDYSLGNFAPHLGVGPMVMDTPGTYSLHPKSADEIVTLKALYDNPQLGVVGGIVVVVDGTQLSRHLLLAEQVKEAGFPMILVITMVDLLKKEGISLDFKYLKDRYNCEVLSFDGIFAGGLLEVAEAIRNLQSSKAASKPIVWNFAERESKIKDAEIVAGRALGNKTNEVEDARMRGIFSLTQEMDRWLLHPILGFGFFIIIMSFLFSSIFWAAAPFMEIVDGFFVFASEKVLELGPGTLWADFLGNGIVASFGAALVFVPQIFILFFGISVLENSGYLARAATVIDRPFSKLGMSGRSFVPILSGFACAVPAMIATRNISSARDRWITTFIVPLMTCSARLPVYALLLAFIFKNKASWKAGVALAALYLGGILIGGIAAGILNRFLPQKSKSFFMMELPLYRKPRWEVLFRQAFSRTMSYVKKAGPPIFIFAVLVWATSTFPNYKETDSQARLSQSYLGEVGKLIEPIMEPMGADWRVGIGLMSAFAAREVFVSSLAIVFNITTEDELEQSEGLLSEMGKATNIRDEPVFTLASVAALLVFFMIALQCMSTVAVAYKEMASMKFALVQLIVFNVAAYILAVITYQTLNIFSL